MLAISGNKIIDEATGAPIYLRGVNIGPSFAHCVGGGWLGLLMYSWSEWQANRQTVIDELDILKGWGCNIIRIHTAVQCWKENIKGFQNIIYDLLGLLQERNMYLLFDFYSILPSSYDSGDYDASRSHPALQPWNCSEADQCWLPIPEGSICGIAGSTWQGVIHNSEMEAVIGNRQDFIDVWADVANKLKDYPNVVFELFNEPHPPAADKQTWLDVCESCIAAIRQVCGHIVIVQYGYGCAPGVPLDWVQDFTSYLASYGNVLIGTHLYRVYGGLGSGGANCGSEGASYSEIAAVLSQIGFDDIVANQPIIVTETGCYATCSANQEIEYTAWQNLLQRYKELGIHYIAWVWRSDSGFKLVNNYTCTPSNPAICKNRGGEILIAALRYLRNLIVNAFPISIPVLVDGVDRGSTPTEPIKLVEGEHIIKVPVYMEA